MKINKKAALHNLGCKVNAYETEAMQQILENAGYEIVPFTEYADVYVVNTCSVTNMADRKSRQMLHKAKKMNPDAIVVGAGCYVQTKEAEALLDDTVDIVIGNNKKHELLAMLEAYENDHGKCGNVIDINHEKQEYVQSYANVEAYIENEKDCLRSYKEELEEAEQELQDLKDTFDSYMNGKEYSWENEVEECQKWYKDNIANFLESPEEKTLIMSGGRNKSGGR